MEAEEISIVQTRPLLSRITVFGAAAVLSLLAGCAEQEGESAGTPPPPQPQSEATQTHAATGTIQTIDHRTGTVTIAHEAVPSLGWPAMTMKFDATNGLTGFREGDHVEFQFIEKAAGGYAITPISARRH